MNLIRHLPQLAPQDFAGFRLGIIVHNHNMLGDFQPGELALAEFLQLLLRCLLVRLQLHKGNHNLTTYLVLRADRNGLRPCGAAGTPAPPP